MSLAICLLAYSMAVAVLAPAPLMSMTRNGAAPRLGVAVWLLAIVSVLAAWLGAAVLSVVQLVDSWDHLGRVLTGCMSGLRVVALGGYGSALQVGLLSLAALSLAALGLLAARVGLALRRTRLRTRAHALTARIAAGDAPLGPGGALVIDSAEPAVYCLAGRPRTVVITKAALTALDDVQLAAVLAHEQAHLRGRHHHLLALTRALGGILSGPRLFVVGAAEIARLLEMCADDAAARRHGRDTVADALLALVLPGGGASRAPSVALSAAGVGVAARVERLLFPPDPTRARIALTLTLAAGLLSPLIVTGLTVLVPMLCGG
jgi:Zn-dependent protease with chaperone function